jgi:hypothetical protein
MANVQWAVGVGQGRSNGISLEIVFFRAFHDLVAIFQNLRKDREMRLFVAALYDGLIHYSVKQYRKMICRRYGRGNVVVILINYQKMYIW